MVNWINKPLNRPWRFHALFIIVSRFSSHLDSVSFSHVPRNAHHMGDGFAKQGMTRRCDFMAWLFYLSCYAVFLGSYYVVS